MQLVTYIDDAVNALFEGRRTARDHIRSADKARDRRDWPRAAKGYAAAISAGASSPGLKVQLGHALKEMGDLDNAEGLYRQFLSAHPEDADIHLQLGHLFNRKGDLATALTFYEQAHTLAPQDEDIALHVATTRRNVGRTNVVEKRRAAMNCVAEGRWEDARQLLRPLVAIDGERDLIGVLANVTKETGRLEEAATLYGAYLRYAKNSGKPELVADCHMQLGHLNKIKGDLTAAFEHFLDARKIVNASSDDDAVNSDVDREILSCLREIYPCFVFQG